MRARQRWIAVSAVVAALAAAAIAVVAVAIWLTAPRWDIRVELREPSLPVPRARETFWPGEDGQAPLLVVIDNAPQARPQAGLAEACLVYAMPTEALITRFLAAFCDASPAAVGPVRSVRAYMLDLAADIGAVTVHAGYSAEARARILRERLPVINEFWTSSPFWRDPGRQAPHNLYASLDPLHKVARQRRPDVRPRGVPYRFGDVPPEAGLDAAVVTLDYAPHYAVTYRYDRARGVYFREQDGQPHVDADGQPVAPVSVIVAFVRWWQVEENGGPSGRLDLTGGGRLTVITRGRLQEGAWSRTAAGPLSFSLAGGAPVVVPRGPVWMEFLPVGRPFEVRRL
ncbi:MAG: DUF3048 domain-containing protein [Armatimonadota bacterium]|nr:DUF3048 domain-containing protein [Armatimonadota bacterium]MDR7485810.1 DUF3048 domain-containing protein [Armatimonadota bacterium]MDR7532107.1 DUF3048 domain-containing protein [Armatimonadota bacterium]MDR7536696.1 DUF3048 domain-containing protein [Armatimonadota bacterium]